MRSICESHAMRSPNCPTYSWIERWRGRRSLRIGALALCLVSFPAWAIDANSGGYGARLDLGATQWLKADRAIAPLGGPVP